MKLALKTADKATANQITQLISFQNKILSPTGDVCTMNYGTTPIASDKYAKGSSSKIETSADSFNRLVDLRVKALCGDASAADYLVNYYGSVGAAQEQGYFTTIAAENGDPSAELADAEILSQQLSDPQAQMRAVFWANRALSTTSDPEIKRKAKDFLKAHAN